MYNGIGEGIAYMFYIAIISVCLVIGISLYSGYKLVDEYFNGVNIESNHIVKPEWKLEGNGKKVDTVYIYNFKK